MFVSDTVCTCVMATLNLRINFPSGVWVGCLLCFAVFAASMVSVMVLSYGWLRRGCGVALARGGVVGAALRWPGGGSAGGMPLVAPVLVWVRAWWDGVHGSDILLGIFLSSKDEDE